jgi:hypothetical protein
MKTIEQLAKPHERYGLYEFTLPQLTAFAEAYHAQKEAEKWISVDDRLPEMNKLVPMNNEAVQWRNITKVVRAIADHCFEDKHHPKYGSCWLAVVHSLTAKDGINIELEPFEASPPVEADPVGEVFWLYEITKGGGVYQGGTGDNAEKDVKTVADAFEESGTPFKVFALPPDTEAKLKIAVEALKGLVSAIKYSEGNTIDEIHQEYKASAMDEAILTAEQALKDITDSPKCPYCTSDNKAIRETYFDQTCAGCVSRMSLKDIGDIK